MAKEIWLQNAGCKPSGLPFCWQLLWAHSWLWADKCAAWIFWTKLDPICTTMWRWCHPLPQGALSPWILPSSDWAWWRRWTWNLQDQSAQRDDDGSACVEPSFTANNHKLLESHADSTVSAALMVIDVRWIWFIQRSDCNPTSHRSYCMGNPTGICSHWHVTTWCWTMCQRRSWDSLQRPWLAAGFQSCHGCWKRHRCSHHCNQEALVHCSQLDWTCYDSSFLFLHRSPADSLSPLNSLLTIPLECLTPKHGFHCSTPRMASFFFHPWTSFHFMRN